MGQCGWCWRWRSINSDDNWSRWGDSPLGCGVPAGCRSSASARLFIEVGSSTGSGDNHVSVCLRLWNWCMPAELVVVGLINVWHCSQCQIGCASGHTNQVTVECVSGGKTGVKFHVAPTIERPIVLRIANWVHVHVGS